MAILKDDYYQDTQTALEFSLLEKEGDCNESCYFKALIRFCFKDRFPVIEKKLILTGEDVDDLIEQLTLLGNREIFNVDFYPLEPCFEMQILHSGEGEHEKDDSYKLTWFLHVELGFYAILGLRMDTKYELIKAFADELRKERNTLDAAKE